MNGGDGGQGMAGITTPSGSPANCHDLAERIERFLDGDLDASEARELDAHLDACLPCTSERELRARLRALVREGCAEQAPADLVARVRARLHEVAGAAEGSDGRG